MSKLHQARFFTTVNELHTLPVGNLPEIAFAGRSNAGKSSAINTLCNQKRLAFASKTPGRTQHINYFGIYAKDELLAYLVDLPGYGYAAHPRTALHEVEHVGDEQHGRPAFAQRVRIDLDPVELEGARAAGQLDTTGGRGEIGRAHV